MLHGDLLGERARLTPDREALAMSDGSLRLTYGELDARVASFAVALRDRLAIAKGDLSGSSPETAPSSSTSSSPRERTG